MSKQKKDSGSKDLQKALKDLNKALDASKKELPDSITAGAALKVEDIYLPLNHLFNAAAKKALKRTVKELNPTRDSAVNPLEKITDTVRYFGATAVGERQIFDAARRVANTINDLATKGFISGALSKLTLIKLVSEEFELDKYAITSFVSITPQGMQFLNNKYYDTEISEGELPKSLEEMDNHTNSITKG